MPRKKRLWSPDHYHHVVVRGNNRQTIFHNVADYDAFFRVLQYAYHKYSFKIVTYCVMSNHYHLLIRSPKVPLGKVMANVNWRYSNYFKKKYHYCGHLYESRYFADLVPSQLDMLSVSLYIHRNPISTSPPMVAKMEDYPYSSYYFYKHDISSNYPFFDTSILKSYLLQTSQAQSLSYCQYCEEHEGKSFNVAPL